MGAQTQSAGVYKQESDRRSRTDFEDSLAPHRLMHVWKHSPLDGGADVSAGVYQDKKRMAKSVTFGHPFLFLYE